MLEEMPSQLMKTAEETARDLGESWVETGIDMFPNMLLAGVLLLLFFRLGRSAANFVDSFLTRRLRQRSALNRVVPLSIRLSAALLGIVLALAVLELDGVVASALAGFSILVIVLGLAFREVWANLIAGAVIAFRQTIRIADHVKVAEDIEGIVKKIEMRTTEIRAFDGRAMHVPNRELLNNTIHNYSTSGQRRISLRCCAPYGSKLSKLQKIATEAVSGLEDIDSQPAATACFEGFGQSSVNFVVRCWVPYGTQSSTYLGMRSKVVVAIHDAFLNVGIDISFPSQDLRPELNQSQPGISNVSTPVKNENESVLWAS